MKRSKNIIKHIGPINLGTNVVYSSSSTLKRMGTRWKTTKSKCGWVKKYYQHEAEYQAEQVKCWYLGSKIVLTKENIHYRGLDEFIVPANTKVELLSAQAEKRPGLNWVVTIKFFVPNTNHKNSRYVHTEIGCRKKDWYEFYNKFRKL